MTTPPFTDDWFTAVERAIARHDSATEGPDLTVEYRCSDRAGLVHTQRWIGGRLAAWTPGPPSHSPDVCLEQPLATNLSMLCRTGDGNRLMRETGLVDPADGGVGPSPLFDEVTVDWAGGLPEIPTAGPLVMRQIVTDAPFGTVGIDYLIERARFTSVRVASPGGGTPRESGEGQPGEPDVTVRRTYRSAVLERAGHLDVLESLAGGSVHGSVHALCYLLGVYDSDECRAARGRIASPGALALAHLGALLSDPTWTTTFASLLRPGTDRP